MVEVGIPIYKARETLPAALDSLVAQTKKMFLVCLSIDGDGEDYTDIIDTYKARGLNIRVIKNEHHGPGAARQHVIDTTQCEYLMFLDADDMLMPNAVKNLSDAIRYSNCDILKSAFVREQTHKKDDIIPQDIFTITWMHGKIYRTDYLRNNNIRFLNLDTEEDANFNLVAWNSTDNRGEITDITYLWRDNKNSLTRHLSQADYFARTYVNYVYGQVKGLNYIYKLTNQIHHKLVTQTLINLYTYYMEAKFRKLDLDKLDEIISTLKDKLWMVGYLNNGENWIDLVNSMRVGAFYDNEFVIFYQEPINKWITRLLRKEENG